MRWRKAAAACALMGLLAGCTTPAPRPTTPPPVAPTPPPIAPPPTVEAPAAKPTLKPPPDVWNELRASFAMDDCITPAVRRARKETRNRKGFEDHMRTLLPLIDYVHRAAVRAGVAGEFVMLPWVESHFREIPPSRHRSAGMWQIMPITARATHLPTSRRYDGRLDKIASTRVAMQLLASYYKKWHDWRLADMAYNTGATRMRRILASHGVPPAKPVIPDLPVGRTTRHHLVKLLAIACVIRDPDRFHVKLPAWNPADRLETVHLHEPAHLRLVARLAGLPLAQIDQLNAGYLLGEVTRESPRELLLPAHGAERLRAAIASGKLHAANAIAKANEPVTYTVVRGDSLWGIAHRFHLRVNELKRWNHLRGNVLQPGQTLRLEPPPAR